MNLDDLSTERDAEYLDAQGEPITPEQQRFLADLTALQAHQRAARLAELERWSSGDPLPNVKTYDVDGFTVGQVVTDSDPTPPNGIDRAELRRVAEHADAVQRAGEWQRLSAGELIRLPVTLKTSTGIGYTSDVIGSLLDAGYLIVRAAS